MVSDRIMDYSCERSFCGKAAPGTIGQFLARSRVGKLWLCKEHLVLEQSGDVDAAFSTAVLRDARVVDTWDDLTASVNEVEGRLASGGGGSTLAPAVAVPSTGTILQEAQAAVYGARQGTYGHPRDDFARTASMWMSYLIGRGVISPTEGSIIAPADVAYMMILLKMSRLMQTPDHRDSIVDIAGYAETAARVMGVDA